jgi:hypothetical protein
LESISGESGVKSWYLARSRGRRRRRRRRRRIPVDIYSPCMLM